MITMWGRICRAWAISRSALLRATSSQALNRLGYSPMMSSVCCPMDPVLPSTAIFRCRVILSIKTAKLHKFLQPPTLLYYINTPFLIKIFSDCRDYSNLKCIVIGILFKVVRLLIFFLKKVLFYYSILKKRYKFAHQK